MSRLLDPSRLSRLTHLGGAVASVGLVVWLGLWGYDAAVRGAHGVPVIRAPSEPMRIQPANPGGEVVDHQGLAVNEIAAIGVAAAPADRLTLAPAEAALTDDDVAGLTPLDAPVPDATTAMAAAAITPAPGLVQEVVAAAAPALAPALGAPSLANPAVPVLPGQAAPASDAVAAALAEALANDGSGADLVPDSPDAAAPVLASAAPLRPRARPTAPATELPTTLGVAAEAPQRITEIDPATLTPGTRLAQLGAFDSPEDARAEWVRATNAYADLMLGKAMVIQTAESGGRSFFRLRAAGFDGEEASRQFCAEIVDRNGTCIPVVQR